MKEKTMAKKKTSARIAKLAGKYAAMNDRELWDEAGVVYTGAPWKRFAGNVRALAASVLSQTEPVKVKRKAR